MISHKDDLSNSIELTAETHTDQLALSVLYKIFNRADVVSFDETTTKGKHPSESVDKLKILFLNNY